MKAKDQTTRTENFTDTPTDATATSTTVTAGKTPTAHEGDTSRRKPRKGPGDSAAAPVIDRPPPTPPGDLGEAALPFTTEQADEGPDTDDTSAPMFTVESIDEAAGETEEPALRRRAIKKGQGIVVRLFTRQVVNVPVHYFEPVKGNTLTLRCNGGLGRCALCDGGLDPVVSSLIVSWCVEDADFVVLGPFGREGGPKSLGGMLKTELRRADFARRVVEVRKSNVDNLYRVTPHASLDPDDDQGDVDFGDDAIRELVKKGGFDPAAVAATVESRTNADLLREYDVLRRAVAARKTKTNAARR